MKMLFTLICLLPLAASAGTAKVSVKLSPAGDFTATTTKVRGFVEKIDGAYVARDLSFTVGSLDSAMDTRNDHMWKELGGKEAKVSVKEAKGNGGKGTAIMTVKGIDKPISFTYVEKGGSIVAKIPVTFSNYNIKPSFLGVSVEDQGDIEAEIPIR